VNGLDLALVLLALLAAFGGWRLGFLTRALGWIGAALGLTLAVLVVPRVLGQLSLSSETAVLLLGLVAFVLIASIGQGIGAAIGSRLRAPVHSDAGRAVDSLGGAALGVVGVGLLAWLILPVMAQTDGWAAASARNSSIARFTVDHLPTPPDQLLSLEQDLAGGNFPELFSGLRPAPDLPPAPTGSPIPQQGLDRLAESTVKVEGPACDLVQSGSGFMVAPGLVATNAHVVAGTSSLQLRSPDGATAKGTVVAFDPRVDLALVATDLDRPVLPLVRPRNGDRGLVFGYPGGGPLAPSPFQVGQQLRARGYDIYDRATVDRDLLVLSSELAPGDSGSAVVRADGSVIGVAVAIAPDRPGVAYALAEEQLAPLVAAARARAPVSTGPCLN
jgi:S1-C subfamily serine protease